MRRFALLALLVVGLGLSSPAGATTSVNLVSATGNTTTPGAQIILDTYVTADGGEMDDFVRGRIVYPNGLVDPPGDLNPPPPDSTDWFQNAMAGFVTGALQCTTLWCTAFYQVTQDNGPPIAVNLANYWIARTTFTVRSGTPLGSVIQFNWLTSPTAQGLDWFGTTNAPSVSITVVPEPATAALVAAGLLAWVVAARRRL